MPRPTSEQGFTLVEMLVALVIFALLAAAGVGILRASVQTEVGVGRGLDRVSAQQRFAGLLIADLGQAIAPPMTGAASGSGQAQALPFDGTSSAMTMIRAGWANPDSRPRSALQRIRWQVDRGGASRTAHLALDGSDPGQSAVVLPDVTSLAFRYRRSDGGWSDSFRSSEKEFLPAAVEVRVRLNHGPDLVVVAALPPRGLEPPPPAQAPGQPT